MAKDFTELVGRTPLLELNRLFPKAKGRVLAKMESLNPMSVKDRAVLGMIRGAMQKGLIGPETEVVEATSGNTGIALASLGAVMGFKVRLFMSELCSLERQKIICAYGAKVVITPAAEHTKGARKRALAYCENHPDSTFFLSQHTNRNNGLAHHGTTGPEIWQQTKGQIGAVIIGLGTCGTLEGLSTFFKAMNPEIKIVGFEPAKSPVYSGGKQGEHHITGIGPGFQTENFKRSRHLLDRIVTVDDEEAYEWTRLIAKTEGLLVGPTSGCAAAVANGLIQENPRATGKVVCLFYDTGERYLSTEGLFLTEGVERLDC